jgi:glycosyltransferase involved in cell wall biosynthesis
MLQECLFSVINQTRSPTEIIVVDDGSTDDTHHMVETCAPNVQYVRQQNSGKSAALNRAIGLATGDYIWIVDDDDTVRPDGLATLIAAIADRPSLMVVYGRHDRFQVTDDKGTVDWLGTGHWRICDSRWFLTATLEDMFAHQGGMLVRRSLYQEIGKFNESFLRSQDYEMQIRLARRVDFIAVDAVIFNMRVHSGQRGVGAMSFDETQRVAAWLKQDQLLFRRLYNEMDLAEFLPRGQSVDGPAQQRLALLQRAVVMSRKKLWDLAIQDFAAAAALGLGPLTRNEHDTVRRSTWSKFGCDEVLADVSITNRVNGLRHRYRDGSRIAKSIASGLGWQIKNAILGQDWSRAAQLIRRFGQLKFGLS